MTFLLPEIDPVLVYKGRQFGGSAGDFENLASHFGAVELGGGFSVAFTARWDALNKWSRIIDFGNGPSCGNIFICNRGAGNAIGFHIWVGSMEYRLTVTNAIQIGETHRFHFVVTDRGHMQAYRDGDEIGVSRGKPPAKFVRQYLYVAKSAWDRDGHFHGCIEDLRVWNKAVDWNACALEEPPEPEPPANEETVIDQSEPVLDGWQTGADGWSADVRWQAADVRWHGSDVGAWKAHSAEGWQAPAAGRWQRHVAPEAPERVEMKPEWEPQGLRERDDGIWCAYCSSGPMTGEKAVLMHLGSQKHQRRLQEGSERLKTRLQIFEGEIDVDINELRPEWQAQGVERRDDGFLWCAACGCGPMASSLLVEQHVATAKHIRKQEVWKLSHGDGADDALAKLKEEFAPHGLVIGGSPEAPEQLAVGELMCMLCNAGPFASPMVAQAHIASKKHQSKQENTVCGSCENELAERWTGHGIEKTDGGFTCTLCDSGVMTAAQVVDRHVETPKHRRRMSETQVELPKEYLDQGLVLNQNKEYTCKLCEAGPFASLIVIEAHIKSKKHQQRVGSGNGSSSEMATARWNLPDYVHEESGGQLRCTLCNSTATSVITMFAHLGGNQHAKKCRGGGHPEVVYVKEKMRLEMYSTGQPVVRTGFSAPGNDGVQDVSVEQGHQDHVQSSIIADPQITEAANPQKTEASIAQTAKDDGVESETVALEESEGRTARQEIDASNASQTSGVLPPGWQAVWHEESGKYYYADAEVSHAQWEPPPTYVHKDWARHVDNSLQAFWASSELGLSFYEHGGENWSRVVDFEGRFYWSNPVEKVRFYETAC